jgi:hypothetical protein
MERRERAPPDWCAASDVGVALEIGVRLAQRSGR